MKVLKKCLLKLAVLSCICTMLVGCATTVRFNTDVEGADVFVDGEPIGKTPTQKNISNAVWEDPDILIRKEGYKDLHTSLTKEPKVGNIIGGCFIWIPLLWCYGPKKNQYFILEPEEKK